MLAWQGFGGRISQDNLCKELGLPLKPDGIDGSKVWGEIQAGNVDKVLKYNQYDVSTVEAIHKKLNFEE
jgi:predicted PolB exonuclease-like 3'-5' exonuclease